MHREVADQFHWVTSPQFSQDFALARLAPGPTTTMSALIGYSVAGLRGAVVATAGVFVPAMLIATAVGSLYLRLGDHPVRRVIAKAIGPIVSPLTAALALAIFALTLRTKLNASLLILGAGVVGALFLLKRQVLPVRTFFRRPKAIRQV